MSALGPQDVQPDPLAPNMSTPKQDKAKPASSTEAGMADDTHHQQQQGLDELSVWRVACCVYVEGSPRAHWNVNYL